jgi:hypothetical protein
MRELLATAGLRPIATIHGFLGHRYAFAAVPEPVAEPSGEAATP